MKTDRKLKADQGSGKSVKGARRAGSKSTPGNGKHPSVTYEHAPIGIVEASLDGNYISVNEEFCRMTGYDRQELLRCTIRDFTHEDDYAIDVTLHERLVAGKIPFYRLEKRYLRRDGGAIWVELTRSLVRDSKGKPLHTVGVVLDISDRKDVERVLRESVERLRLATEAAQMFMWEWDFVHQTYSIADNFQEVLGFSGGLLPRNPLETVARLVPPEDVQQITRAYEKAVESHSDLHALACRVINPENGQTVWLEVSAKIVYGAAGDPVRMFGVAQNITQSKEAQEEIAALSRLPAENPDPVMRITPDGKILYGNDPSAPLRETWVQQPDAHIPDELQKAITKAYTSGVKQELEIEHNGTDFSFTLAPIREAGYVNLYARDITESKRAEESVHLARSQAEQSADRTARLQKVTAALSVALTPSEVAEVLVNQAAPGFGAVSSTMMLLSEDHQTLEIIYSTSPEIVTRPYQQFPVSLRVPAADAVRSGELVWVESRQQYLERYPHLAEQIEHWGQQSAMAIPMVYKQSILGVLTLSFDRVLPFNAEDREYALTLARQGAQALERARAETALRESEERFRALVSQATAGIVESDMDSRLVFVNPRLCEMLGYSREELIGKTMWELTYAEDLEQNRRLFTQMLNEGESHHFEKRFIRKDGSLLWTDVNVSTIRDLDGKARGGVGVIIDIQERKQTEQALQGFAREQAALYSLAYQLHRTTSFEDIYNSALDAILSALECDRASILLYDHQGVMRFIAWHGLSDVYRQATDGHSPWTPDAVDPEPIAMHDVDTADLSDSLRTIIKGEGIGSLAFIPLVSNGRLIGKFMIYFNEPHVFREDELDLSLTIARQLAFAIDRKRGEDHLRQSEERFRQAANASRALVYEVDLPSGATAVVHGMESLVGYQPQDVVISSDWWHALIHPEDLPGHLALLDEHLQKGGAAVCEYRVRHKNGGWVIVQDNRLVTDDGEGRAVRMIGTVIDITERKQAERRLALLAEISEMLRNFEDPNELFYAVSKVVGEHLHVRRALFNETDLEHDLEIVRRDYYDGVESVAGVHKVSDYSSMTSAEMKAGKTVVNVDSKLDPRTAQDYERTYAPSHERAYVAVPLMREHRWVGTFWVSDAAPRQWSHEEISLLEAIAERTWTTVEKLRLTEELRAKEAELEEVINQTPFMLARCTRDLHYRFVSRAYAEMIGRTPEEVAGKPIVEIMGEEGLTTMLPHVERVLQGEQVEYESEVSFRDVGTRFLHVVYTPDWDEQGNVAGWFASIVDISERRRTEEALRIENERFMRFVNSNIVGILIGNETGQVLLANDYYLNLLGVTRQDLMDGKVDWQKFTPPEWLPADQKAIRELREYGVCEPYEKEYVRSDGTRVPVYVADALLPGPGKEIAAFVIDITERKRAEEALRRNEELFSRLVEAAPFGVYFIDSEFRLRAINKGSEEVFKDIYPLIGRDFAEILRTVWQEPFATEAIERFRHTLRTGESFISPPVIEPRANIDEIQSYDWQIHRIIMPDGTYGVVCYFYDLSEQKRMEATVRASEALYRAIAGSIPDGAVYVVDKDFRYLVAEGPVTEAFGLSRQMLEGHTVTEVFPDERGKRMEERLRRTFAGETISFETRHNERVYWTRQAPLLDAIGQAIILTLDITERQQAEEALRQSEERFALFMQHLPGLAWIKDVQGRYVYANAAAEKAFNAPREILYGKTDLDIFPEDVAEQFKMNDERALSDGMGVQVIETLKQDDGVVHHSLVSKFPIPGPDGTASLIGGTAFDITERLQAEEALRESEERLRAILRQATAGIVRKDAEGKLIFVNQAFCNMLGYTEAELLGKSSWDFMHEEDVAENKRFYNRMMVEGVPFKLERRLLREDGSMIWVDASVSPIMGADGKPQSAVAVEVDITGRKQAEEALQQLNLQLEERVLSRTAKLRATNQTLREEITERKRVEEALRKSEAIAHENEAKLRSLFELLPVGISFLNLDGKIIQMNQALSDILKLSREDFRSQSYRSRKYIRADGTPMPPSEFASARAIAENRTIYNVETGVVLESGEVIWTSVSAAPVDVADVSVVVVTVDITENKRAEQALHVSHARLRILSQRLVEVQEEERRALARELHDRVGQTLAALNINLIIINSQLSGEAAEQIGTRLNDSMKLVAETIALVRDVMTDLRPAVLDDYGLEAALEAHLSKFMSRYDINVKFEKPEQPLPRLGPSIEMTLLRIAQEALMNIARHAQATHVNLSVQQEEDAICMTIQDNGIGIQSWQEANRPGSHGMTIMRERAEAFGGSLQVRSIPGQGTKIEALIPLRGRKETRQEKNV